MPSGWSPRRDANCIWSSRWDSTCPNPSCAAPAWTTTTWRRSASTAICRAAWEALAPTRVYAFTAHADDSFADISYRPGDVLMFGPEPTGLDSATLADPHISAQVRIPMLAGRRSLNLSNAAAVAVYEAWRQHGFAGAASDCYQLFQCVTCSAGSRLAGRKSVPLV